MKKMLSDHFSYDECKCKHCGKEWTDPRLLALAERVRWALGNRPMIPTSVCRCRDHNAEVGGAVDSQHVYGRAMDFKMNGVSPEAIYETLKALHRCGYLPGGVISARRISARDGCSSANASVWTGSLMFSR